MLDIPSLTTTKLPRYDQAIKDYADVQGNILKGHGRDHAAFLFIELTSDKAKSQAWLQSLLDGTGPVTLTSTAKQLQDTVRFKQFRIPGDLFAMILFTTAGVEALGQTPPTEPKQADLPPSVAHLAPAFSRGMRTEDTRQLLSDPAPEPDVYDPGWFKPGTAEPTPLHALLLLADDDFDLLQRTVRAVSDDLTGIGEIRILEWGHALRNADGNGIEHFGYADGVSQPVYLANDMPNDDPTSADFEDIDRWDPSATPEELVLVPDPLGKGQGSFFVFRKLQQYVREFKEAEEKLAKRLALAKGDEERAGAMLVGRYEDGTPVVERGSDGLINPIANNFDYAEDMQGHRCPFHSHIRKMNPRGETAQQATGASAEEREEMRKEELLRRLTRRGIPFGDPEEAQKEDGKPVGLLFMCFQRNIAQQYEFIQKFWANNAGFLKKEPATGLDPIIGQGTRDKLRFNYTYGGAGCRQAEFKEFVKLRGGEYFYAPSMSGLRALAGDKSV
ncbi:Dyp-type peroxidase [Hymenobacter fodinae]|uniref:Dyp-type peroxidase n=1 Tax=Hymenobacter fodinae TaxID=2510796 RepID=A0A4Z0P364_9BACT|nr:Dyp-type peroxidase [Hymenobacter fodinae]TGE05450.1 Dyp-type peroxidase [Hymenobacter fodinae]